ncbi:hypothetical protein FACS189447_10670 [Spirochaetia bacterium]|nr:hypothetical protein FACS189447_10670 [Spirochaetia bacterium]
MYSFINLAFSAETFKLVNSIYGSYAQMSSDKRTVLLPALLRESLRYKLLYPSSGHASLFKVSRREIFIGVLIDCLCFLRGQGLGGADVPAWLTGACEAMLKKNNYIRGIKQFVKLSGKTQEHLTRSMKRFYSLTPTSYINSIRLGEAARLLYASKLSILDIQNECGFPNASHFNMLFKAEFGISPSRYRRLTTQPF